MDFRKQEYDYLSIHSTIFLNEIYMLSNFKIDIYIFYTVFKNNTHTPYFINKFLFEIKL